MSDRHRQAGDAYAELLAREHDAGIDVFAPDYDPNPLPPRAGDGEPTRPQPAGLLVAVRSDG